MISYCSQISRRLGLGLYLVSLVFSCESPKSRILVFSKTEGYRHESIEAGIAAIQKLGQESDFLVDATEDALWFDEQKLATYSAVVFLNTAMNVLDPYQQADFERFIQAGGGFVGVHSAADTEYGWSWYGKLVGGYFDSHPRIQVAKVNLVEDGHPSTSHLPEVWEREDEWYNYKDLNRKVKVLMTVDESSYEGGTLGDYHPVAWYHEYDGGRAFYTGLGHTPESFEDPFFCSIC